MLGAVTNVEIIRTQGLCLRKGKVLQVPGPATGVERDTSVVM
jgi:hypothetical protein